jgi:hypothetical protein
VNKVASDGGEYAVVMQFCPAELTPFQVVTGARFRPHVSATVAFDSSVAVQNSLSTEMYSSQSR